MKTYNLPSLPTPIPIDKRAEKIAALKAVSHGEQPVSNLKEYRKRLEWKVIFWLMGEKGTYKCIEMEPSWNWHEEEPICIDSNTIQVKIERFRQLEQLWQQTSRIDKTGTYSNGLEVVPDKMVDYESVLSIVNTPKDSFFVYSMDISNEVYELHFKPFRESPDTNPLIVQDKQDTNGNHINIWNKL